MPGPGLIHRWLVCVAAIACAWPAMAEDPLPYEEAILPIVSEFCVDCHNPDRAKGDLDIERFETMASVQDSIAVWQRMAKRIESKEMPPRSEEIQPTEEQRTMLLKWIGELKEELNCEKVASEESQSWYPGYVMSRRLNRWEYENTLQDLLQTDLDVAEMFPADGAGGEGFDNNGNALFLSAIQAEKYLEAAEYAIDTAFKPARWAMAPAEGVTTDAALASGVQQDPHRAALVPVVPGADVTPREAARQSVALFAAKAWRRPVDNAEVDRLLTLFDRAFDRGDGFEAGIKLAYTGAIMSPNFLFLAEPQPDVQGEYLLGDHPLAARLSYFLWGTLPDAELTALADSGQLQHEDVLKAQVARMLADPKSQALGDIFATQWLGITQLGQAVRPDENRFPEYSDGLRDAMVKEATVFFAKLVQEDRSLLDLIDSDYTYCDEQLAKLYGIEGVTGPELQRVTLADSARGGVLGMAAVLTATSHPLRTSPVLRGKWVLEQLLGDRMTPPPPNAGALPEDDQNAEGLTLRQQLEAHRQNPDCASCHNRMDPIGFGLENFDPIGRWRSEQMGQPIDTVGELPSGEKFDGPDQLKAILLARKDEFAQNLVRKMLGYALGRSLTKYDQCVIDDCMKALRENEYRPSVMFTEIVMSYPFRNRYSAGQPVQVAEAAP